MTDLEITKLCAEAMGLMPVSYYPDENYDPLHDDAQCFALVKKFQVVIEREMRNTREFAVTVFPSRGFGASVSSVRNSTDLNRAICECVAHMQKAKHA